MDVVEAKLADVLCLALQARLAARPARSSRLELLARFSFEELLEYARTGRITRERVRLVAPQIGESQEVVKDLLRRLRREDLSDYAKEHEYALRCFRQAGADRRLVATFFEGEAEAKEYHFVLHGMPHVWEGQTGVLSDVHIEQDEDDDLYPYECEGYLIEQGMVFGSFVELLAFAYQNQWPGWEHLWAEDWLDRL